MRILLVLVMFITAVASKAQIALPANFIDYQQQQRFTGTHQLTDSLNKNKKWFFTSYAGISTSFGFFKGGNVTTFAVPLTLQLNRKLNNNLYVFAAVSAAPAYTNFNNAFLFANSGKNWQGNSVMNARSLGIYSRAELGLMYINDEKTFSISGSIGIERSSYPMLPYNQPATTRPNPVIHRN